MQPEAPWVVGTKVSDLSSLQGMPLSEMNCTGTQVSDLSPLNGMPLEFLGCSDTPVSDLETTYRVMRAFMMLKDRPDDVESMMHLGSVLAEMGRYEEAAALFSDVLRLDPNHAAAQRLRALAKAHEPG